MSYVGGGWRSGTLADVNTGAAPTTTVSNISPTTASRKAGALTLTVNGGGFDATCVIHANYNPVATRYVSANQLVCDKFNPMPDSGQAGIIEVGVRKSGQKLSNIANFTAT